MKSFFCSLASIFMGCFVLASATTTPQDPTILYMNQIAAVANDRAITSHQIGVQLSEETNGRYNNNPDMLDKLGRKILQHNIDMELMNKEFERMKGKAPEHFKDKRFIQILNEDFGGNRVIFSEYLHMTGQSAKAFKDDIQKNAISSFMLKQRIGQHFEVSPLQIKEFYDAHYNDFYKDAEIDISQVAIFPHNGCQDIDATIDDIYKKFSKNENLNEIVKKYHNSCDISVTPLGKISLADVIDELRQEVGLLQEGMASKPIKIKGHYIMIIVNKWISEAHQLTLQEASDDIEKKISKKLSEELYNKWIAGLRARYYNKTFI
ncbi:MAG: hypothetical protein LBB20_00820 [Puniceicoccales bacterium]|jgi:hypothetical protein|nr:hypothetical protein [Puniceicoccales bacterium]